jgi:SecD/SecF fusion protein
MKTVLILLATCLTPICPAMGDAQENRSVQPDRFLKAMPPTGNFAGAPAGVPAQKGEIDSLGGVSFTLSVEPRIDADGAQIPVTPAQVDQAIVVIKKRLDGMGAADYTIAGRGGNGILLQLPGVKQAVAARVRAALESVAKLELHEVSPRNDETDANGKSLVARVKEGLEIVPGYKVFEYKHKDADGKVIVDPILLNRRVALGSSDVAQAFPSQQQPDAVSVTLNGPGTDKMIALTANMRPGVDRIAIVLDGQVLSAPVIRSVPLGKDFIIEGLNDPGEVQNLANALTNPLGNPLKIDEMRTIPPKSK